MREKEILYNYLTKANIPDLDHKMLMLDEFTKLLREENNNVNLISRKTTDTEIWLNHIMDSLLPVSILDLNNTNILDFGTGGGLPGIPLKIIFPTAKVYLLDSRHKKMEAVKKIIKKLDLHDCLTICSRLEDLDSSWQNYFHAVVCRSVKIIPAFWKKLDYVTRNKGSMFFYKAKDYPDLYGIKGIIKHDLSQQNIGVRTLIEIKKEHVPRGTSKK